MKNTLKNLSATEFEIEIEVSTEELDKFIERVVSDFSKDAKAPGFRPGKVPKEIVERNLSPEKVLSEAAELAVNDGLNWAIKENNLSPISYPQIHVHKLARGNPFVFCAKITIMPQIDLPGYREIAKGAERKKVFVEEKEIEEALRWVQKSRAKLSLKNAPAEMGDFVEVEYWSPEIEGTTNPKGVKDAFVLGEGKFLPGFEEKLVGMKGGDEKKDISLKMPEKYFVKNLAGKEIHLKAKMNSVQKMELAEINDEFAKNAGNFDSVSSLKNSIKDGISSEKQEAETQRLRNEILDKINKSTKFEIPESLVLLERDRMLEDYKKSVTEQFQISFPEYLEKTKKTEKEVMESFLPQAERRIKNSLILKEIGKKENVSVSEEEIGSEVGKILKSYPDAAEAKKKIDLNHLRDYTKETLYYEKTFKLLEGFIN